jgi:hypothetical protein
MKKSLFILLIFVLPLFSVFSQTRTSFSKVREYALDYLIEDADELSRTPTPELVEICIEKFNKKTGPIDSNDILLIDGEIIDYYKTMKKVDRLSQLTSIDLAMIRFVFGGINNKSINLSTASLIFESLEKIRWDGIKAEHAYFYFDDGFIKTLINRLNYLRSKPETENNLRKLENFEVELLTLMLQLWDTNLSYGHKKELISLTKTMPKDIQEEILISKMVRFLPEGKYPRNFQSLLDYTIHYILVEGAKGITDDRVSDLLVRDGLLYIVVDDIEATPKDDPTLTEKICKTSLLVDEANPKHFELNKSDLLLYYDYKDKIDQNYNNLKVLSKLKKTLNTSSDNITTILDLLVTEIIDNDLIYTEVIAGLLCEPSFYLAMTKEIEEMPEGQEKKEAEIILFLISCTSSWNDFNGNIKISDRTTSLQISDIMTKYVGLYTSNDVMVVLNNKKICNMNTKPVLWNSISKMIDSPVKPIIKIN